jgi:hypothetical protein
VRKPRHVVVAIECDLPPRVSAAEFRKYLIGEACAGVGCLSPDDPLFHLDRSTVRGTVIPRDIEWLYKKTAKGTGSALYRRWFA